MRVRAAFADKLPLRAIWDRAVRELQEEGVRCADCGVVSLGGDPPHKCDHRYILENKLSAEDIELRHKANVKLLHEIYTRNQWRFCPWCGEELDAKV